LLGQNSILITIFLTHIKYSVEIANNLKKYAGNKFLSYIDTIFAAVISILTCFVLRDLRVCKIPYL